jgi:hypothetical protein
VDEPAPWGSVCTAATVDSISVVSMTDTVCRPAFNARLSRRANAWQQRLTFDEFNETSVAHDPSTRRV